MDIVDVFSSDSQQNHQSHNSEGRETISTESHKHSQTTKTKNIKKKYEPILDGGKLIKYEDNPTEYKRLRKKIQNRESATRVRGRKKNAFEDLEQEVQYLRKQNSQLQLSNAKLETQNKSLKDQMEFMKSLIRPAQCKDPVEQYLASEVLNNSPSPSPSNSMSDDYESPFFQEFNWIRPDSSNSQNFGWGALAIFTIILAVFVLPSQPKDSSFGAWASEQAKDVTDVVIPLSSWFVQSLRWIAEYGKTVTKYSLILIYVWVVFGRVTAYLRSRKLKKV